jgi:hypothetical protein
MPSADPIGVDERHIAQWSAKMTRYLRPIIMSALLALTFAVAACANDGGGSSDQRSKSNSSSPFGSGDSGGE